MTTTMPRIDQQTQIDVIAAMVRMCIPLDGKRVAFLPCGDPAQVVVVVDGVYLGKFNKEKQEFDEMILGGCRE